MHRRAEPFIQGVGPRSNQARLTAAGAFLLIAALVFVSACAGKPAPPPPPIAAAAADRLAGQAAKLQAEENWAGAADWWQRAGRQLQLLNRETEVAMARHNEGVSRRALGQSAAARALLELAAADNQRLRQTNAWWRNQIVLLQLDVESTNAPAAAVERLGMLRQRSAELATFPALEPLLNHEEARLQLRLGQLAEAGSAAEHAVSGFKALGDSGGVGAARVTQARILAASGNHEAADVAWRDALATFERLGNVRGVAISLAGLGVSLSRDPARAAEAGILLRRAVANFNALQMGPESKAAEAALDRLMGTAPSG